jgi:hypothetical protein
MPTHLMPVTPCPYCNVPNDAATNPEGEDGPPNPGDVTICLSCGEFLLLDADLRTVKPNDDELIELGADPMCRLMRMGWVLYDAKRKASG